MTKKNKSKVSSSTSTTSNVDPEYQKRPPVSPQKDDPLASVEVSHYNIPNTNKFIHTKPGNYNFAGNTAKDRIALVMMVKNEDKRIEVSFDSVKDITNTFVILDTGSQDRTIEITKNYCKKNGITLHLKEEPFVNFEVSRNVLLDFADEVLKNHFFLLQLDCNDELRNHSELVKFVEQHKGVQTGFHLRQQWWTGGSLDTYFNIRMVISHFGWRYKGVVHEYIARKSPVGDGEDILKCNDIILFQDRTKDDDKSMRRFKRDKDLLYSEHLKHPTEPRTLFYLAQTCSCLNQLQEAYEYNLLRTKQQGFLEEVYHSYFRMGQISHRLNHPWEESLGWYLKAYAHSKRVEPLCEIAEYYMEHNAFGEKQPDWHLAFMYINQACKLAYCHQQILFVNKHSYIYKRWHLMGRIGFYANRFEEGKEGCIKALQTENNQVDINNLVLYLRREREVAEQLNYGQPQHIDPMMSISLNIQNTPSKDILPAAEPGLGFGTAFKREDILSNAMKATKLLK